MTNATPADRRDRLVLATFLNGTRIGSVFQSAAGTLRFAYLASWRTSPVAYPLSLSMPLTAEEHRHDVINAFLWGLLPDNEQTLEHYGRLFGVSVRTPVALLGHIGADCAGAVQFAPPEKAEELESKAASPGGVTSLSEKEIAAELRTVRKQGIPGTAQSTVGQFSLAGAQPKIALLEENGRWARPSGRTPTNRILKPPTGEYLGFAENEHFCLELAAELSLGSVRSRIQRFEDEVAIVVERFDRERRQDEYFRVHQEDICQALGVMPHQKYESQGGPGLTHIITLLRESSSRPDDDIDRILRATALNWVIAATDAHAKNYALLHGGGGRLRLAPFYDILSFLPYTTEALHRVKSAMKVGGEYLIKRIGRRQWANLAASSRLDERRVFDNVMAVIERLPSAIDAVAARAISHGLDETIVEQLEFGMHARTSRCLAMLTHSS